uniref:Uncharacterized protein n=1 Tax=Heterorhabditis bacteriophora TaxID=37862 RepID=A0A1I7X7E0_HETBA
MLTLPKYYIIKKELLRRAIERTLSTNQSTKSNMGEKEGNNLLYKKRKPNMDMKKSEQSTLLGNLPTNGRVQCIGFDINPQRGLELAN